MVADTKYAISKVFVVWLQSKVNVNLKIIHKNEIWKFSPFLSIPSDELISLKKYSPICNCLANCDDSNFFVKEYVSNS